MASDILDLRTPNNNHKKNPSNQMGDILDATQELSENPGESYTEEPTQEGIEQLEQIDENAGLGEEVKQEEEITEEEPLQKDLGGSDKDEGYFEEYQDIDPADKLFGETPDDIDKPDLNPDNPDDMDEDLGGLIAWTSPDRHHELISHAWRKTVIVVLVAMVFAALFWQKSILTAITFFGLALVTSMHFWREDRHERYEIHPHGMVVGSRFYHYHDFDSFCIHYHPEGYHELSLCTGKLLNHYIKVSLKDQDPFEIRDVLSLYLPEEQHEQGLDDLLRRKLGL